MPELAVDGALVKPFIPFSRMKAVMPFCFLLGVGDREDHEDVSPTVPWVMNIFAPLSTHLIARAGPRSSSCPRRRSRCPGSVRPQAPSYSPRGELGR